MNCLDCRQEPFRASLAFSRSIAGVREFKKFVATATAVFCFDVKVLYNLFIGVSVRFARFTSRAYIRKEQSCIKSKDLK